MRKFLKVLIVILSFFTISLLAYGYLCENDVITILSERYNKKPTELKPNEYIKDAHVDFVSLTDDFIADNKQELLNIYYTVISSGMSEFTFYCGDKYYKCGEDIETLMNGDNATLSIINDLVSVYNTFKTIKTTTYNQYNSIKATIYTTKMYNEAEITSLKNKVDEVYDEIISDNIPNVDNVKIIHDYIINNTKYNTESDDNDTTSNTAVGVFYNKLATCNGYTDATALLLDKLGIPNLRISNETHIWNVVLVNGRWLHMDVTWDDPVNNLDKDLLLYTYFLKPTNEFDKTTKQDLLSEHEFNKEVYYFIAEN